jgi:hypothetical protein
MASRALCEREMLAAPGCRWKTLLTLADEQVNRIPQGEEVHWKLWQAEPDPRCHDCDGRVGEYRHLWCDNETCPVCGN